MAMDIAVAGVRSADEARALYAQLEKKEVGDAPCLVYYQVKKDRPFYAPPLLCYGVL